MLDLRQLDLNLLLAFDAIYQQRSVSRAAQVMNLSQPAMSNALRRLRTLCGDPLFIKNKLGVTPTLTAHRLADYVRSALDSLREGLRMIPAGRQGNPLLRISCLDCLQPVLLDALLQAPQSNWQIRYFQPRRRDALLDLATGRLDILVDLDQPLAGLAGLHKQPLPADHYVFAYGAGLSEPPRTLQSYLAQPQIQVSSRRDGLSPVDLHLGLKGQRRTIAVTTQSTLAAKLIADRQPFGLSLPSRVASVLGLQQAPLPFDEPVELLLALYMESKYRFERSREQAMQCLLQALSQTESPLELARRA
ncbi:LysR family transcriptional regulator [Pseudomonas akapageensis]|uniref:LysR family transcriptional regulator n=1 Tax=Pseudomonas akapageensis TaxID=2609961 RepID=UPI00140CD4D3|nr:LysR family transcriptional regulator [Pseudomonas akapageensis]